MTITIGSLNFTINEKKYKHPVVHSIVEPIEIYRAAPDGTTYHYCDGTIKKWAIPLVFTESDRIILESYRQTATTLTIGSENPITVKLIGNYEYKRKYISGIAVYEETLVFLGVSS